VKLPGPVRTLSLVPKGWHSWDFRVLEGGREIAFIDRDWFRERAAFTLEGVPYEVRRTSVLRGTFALERGGRLLAEATKTSIFRRSFDVRIGREPPYRLKAAAPLRREFRLVRGGVTVGQVKPDALFRRAATARFPATLPLPVQLFLTFLVLVLWKRDSDAGAASGG
jgi:hypothetical protein